MKSKKISLIINEDLEHNSYSEYEDLFKPMKEYYEEVFPIDGVIDKTAHAKLNPMAASRISRLSLVSP